MRNVVILVIWVVLMCFWLFGGGYYVYNSGNPNIVSFGTGTLIPWLCVAIPGYIVFSGTTAQK